MPDREAGCAGGAQSRPKGGPAVVFFTGMGYDGGAKGGDDMPYEKLRLTAMTTAGG